MRTVIVEPVNFQYEIEHFHYESWYTHDYDYIKVRPPVDGTEADFLTVHYPDSSALPTEGISINNLIGVKVTDGDNLDLILFSNDGNPVDEYIELDAHYQAIDGGAYLFESTGVRAQFDSYQVLRLRKSADVSPPVITSVDATNITTSSATINWTTDELAASQVEYGTTEELGLTTDLDTSSTTDHSVSLTDLALSTVYYYRVKSEGAAGNPATSSIYNFTTSSENSPSELNPIGDKTVNEGQLLEFTISATDADGHSLTYSASNLPQGANFDPDTQTFSWTPGYDQAGVYPDIHFEVSDGSLTDSEDITITVNTASPSVSGGGGGSVLAGGGSSSDETPTTIYNIVVSETTKTSTDICWTTNEWSTSQVEYWASPSQLSPLDEEMVIEHKVHLTNLNPAATYYFKTLSMDKAGNLSVSDEYNFTTLGTPAAFSVSALEITQAEVDIGEEVIISVLVTNSGDGAGSYEVVLKIDDAVIATEDVVDLAGGDSQRVTFTTAKDSAGMATVDVNGLGASFVVKEAPATEAPTTEINVFSVTPSYNSETGKLIFAKVICEINNLSEPATDVELILKVSRDGEPIEEVPLIIPSQLQPGEITGSRDYIPPVGWENGTYTFQLYVDGKSYTTTMEEKLEVTVSSDAPVVSWATLDEITRGMLITIAATVAIILLRRRRLLKAQVFEEVKVVA